MSIPPLVCSTPPPPDQCDDQDGPGDFDLQYNLSQEDENNEYGYEDFSSYSIYQLQSTKTYEMTSDTYNDPNKIPDKPKPIDGKVQDSKLEDIKENSINPNNIKFDDVGDDIENKPIDTINEDNSTIHTDTVELSERKESEMPSTFESINSIEATRNSFDNQSENDTPAVEFNEIVNVDSFNITNTEMINSKAEDVTDLNNEDDDFGEFEDFQCVSTEETLKNVIDDCSNPWEQNDPVDSSFGDFTANFDDQPNLVHNENIQQQLEKYENNEDDDFGDFDDFKSSSVDATKPLNEVQEFSQDCMSLPDSESQIMDNIMKVINTMFDEEISEPESSLDGNLESLLCETWGHLVDVDERQPYIVPWNNCLGQKTLLKALCIDSRNILFGPKWSYNMPKFAANLSTAPLQPQKQVPNTVIASSEAINTEKSAVKPNTSWIDPFKNDGQESCNMESESTPNNLNVFEASNASKPGKIYSSTPSVQPIRQINLPDTHIFTPSDSETPRSKTIHYNSNQPVIVPQELRKISKESETLKTQHNTNEKDNEYSDFQDFTSSSCNTNTTYSIQEQSQTKIETPIVENASSVVQKVQILQPIKLEPIIPTLNWPDPGEVKETFDDFADFLSSTTINHVTQSTELKVPSEEDNLPDKSIDKTLGLSTFEKEGFQTSKLDDEFDTFQSALPINVNCNNYFTTETKAEIINNPQVSSDKTNNFDLSKNFVQKSLQGNGPQSMPLKLDCFDNVKESKKQNTMSQSLFPNPLQSTSAPLSMHNQPKSGQILQPLSLESYSQINWPNPGIDLQDLSRFNPVETLQSLKSDLNASSNSKTASPINTQRTGSAVQSEDDIWGEFVSSKPKTPQTVPKKSAVFVDDDEWTDFVSSPTVKPQNGLNTISLNVHTNLNMQKSSSQSKFPTERQTPLEIPALNYITPKSSNHRTLNDRHFQNL